MIGSFISAFEGTMTSMLWAGARGGRRQRQTIQRVVVRQTNRAATDRLITALHEEKVRSAHLEAEVQDLRRQLELAGDLIDVLGQRIVRA